MLPPVATKAIDGLTNTVVNFSLIMIGGMVAGLILAHLIGRKSKARRQTVFSGVMFVTIILTAIFMNHK